MVFLQKPVSLNISLIYGFQTQDKDTYDFVLLLERKLRVTYVHGMLSRVPFIPIYKDLWAFLQRTVKTPMIGLEILNKHYMAYKTWLPIFKEVETKSFDGYPTKLLLVKKTAILK